MKLLKFLLLILLSINLCACASVRELLPKEQRDFQERSFDSKIWRDGDAIERGRMKQDIVERKIIYGKNKEQVLEILGEPDEKIIGRAGEEIWFYNYEVVGKKSRLGLPVSFDKDGKAYVGIAKT